MRKLVPSSLEPNQVFNEIASAKRLERGERLKIIALEIYNYYKTYSESISDLSAMNPIGFTGLEKEDLEDCYSGKTNPLNKLLADIRELQDLPIRNQCQYCGIASANTFDHYLPISIFPEFAVFSLNLLPCCDTCNKYKSNIFLVEGKRQIINLYYDNLLSERYLNVSISYKDDVPSAEYSLIQPIGISDSQFSLIQSHYTKLKLLERFRNRSPEVLSETQSSIKTHIKAKSNKRVIQFLLEEAQRLRDRFSNNHWKVVLHEEMANSSKFIEDCWLTK
jgi:hypothetical protein